MPKSPVYRKQRFLQEFGRRGTLSAGCRAAGVSPGLVHDWLDLDPEFQRRFHEAKLRFQDRLHEMVMRRLETTPSDSLLLIHGPSAAPGP